MAKLEFNPKVHEKLREHNIEAGIEENEALLYLLSAYYNVPVQSTPTDIVRKVNLTKIVERDYETPNSLPKFNIDLFDKDEQVNEAWEWVDKEYRALFAKVRMDAKGDKNGCVTKMMKFFALHPEIRKDDVLTATKLYIDPFLANQQNVKYMQRADYFISKTVDGSKLSRLEQYLEQLKTFKAENGGINPRFKTLT
jgi:hypothetical protein